MAKGDWIERLVHDLVGGESRDDEVLELTPAELRAGIQALLGAGIMLVIAERIRQVEVELRTPEGDRHWRKGELARAAAAYLYASTIDTAVAHHRMNVLKGDPGPRASQVWGIIVRLWPWGWDWWKPHTRHRDLVRGVALGVAELDRMAMDGDQS